MFLLKLVKFPVSFSMVLSMVLSGNDEIVEMNITTENKFSHWFAFFIISRESIKYAHSLSAIKVKNFKEIPDKQ